MPGPQQTLRGGLFFFLHYIHPSVFPSIFQSPHHIATGASRVSPFCLSTARLSASPPVSHSFHSSLQPFLLCVFVTCLSPPSLLSITQIIQYCQCQLGTSRSPPTLANTPLAKGAKTDAHLQTQTHQGDVSEYTASITTNSGLSHSRTDAFQDSACQNTSISAYSNSRSSSYPATFSICLRLTRLEFLSFPPGLPPL